MNSYDRMKKLCIYHGIERKEFISRAKNHFAPGKNSVLGYYPTHDLLDELDRKIGVDTRGGLHHDAFCRGWASPNNQVGTRIRLHEEFIRPDYFPGTEPLKWPDDYHFWLGAGR
jgi:hypothetical protein